jgi:hypothetical protein
VDGRSSSIRCCAIRFGIARVAFLRSVGRVTRPSKREHFGKLMKPCRSDGSDGCWRRDEVAANRRAKVAKFSAVVGLVCLIIRRLARGALIFPRALPTLAPCATQIQANGHRSNVHAFTHQHVRTSTSRVSAKLNREVRGLTEVTCTSQFKRC